MFLSDPLQPVDRKKSELKCEPKQKKHITIKGISQGLTSFSIFFISSSSFLTFSFVYWRSAFLTSISWSKYLLYMELTSASFNRTRWTVKNKEVCKHLVMKCTYHINKHSPVLLLLCVRFVCFLHSAHRKITMPWVHGLRKWCTCYLNSHSCPDASSWSRYLRSFFPATAEPKEDPEVSGPFPAPLQYIRPLSSS